ncbi:unnamed protein product [Paramecium primaurelia]|uniref:t-SNARE coiled-coil homology domain-containing protein n=1 Tax=Paramecium primaurelia TaxID=5886 RepID=A0A8S1JNS9_PARPR|nr:unnamed protein product [Paramecium primaurelia]
MNNYTALSGGSQFQDIIEEIKKVDAIIAQGINQRNQRLFQKESVQLIDRQLGQQINNINELIKQGRTQLYKMKNLSQNEQQRQKNKLDEFQNRSNEFSRALQVKQIFNMVTTQTNKEYGEKSDTEMVQIQKTLKKEQDKILDNMLQTTDIIANNTKTINLALKEDKVILINLNNNVEQATNEIQAVDSKLKTLLSYTNDWCLWIIILIEFVVFIFLVIN